MNISTLLPQAPKFDRMECRVRDLQVGKTHKKADKVKIDTFEIDGRQVTPTSRFWTSIFSRYGFGDSIFRYFSHSEVFGRISEVASNDKLVCTIEQTKDKEKPDRMLAISAPNTKRVDHDDLIELLHKYGVKTNNADYGVATPKYAFGGAHGAITSTGPGGIHGGDSAVGNMDLTTHGDGSAADVFLTGGENSDVPTLSYDTGVVRSIHMPRVEANFDIAGDMFGNRFCLDTPIDGYGKPSIYLMLLRTVCANLAIGYAKAFRSDISIGKGEEGFEYALVRAFEGYNNEEGFMTLRQRFESAANSWASVNEVNKVYKSLVRLHHKGEMRNIAKKFMSDQIGTDGAALMEGSAVMRSFHQMTGDLTKTYGLANLDALSQKRQRTLPTQATMYDLLNFTTETATHYTAPAGQRILQAAIGDFLSSEYDLEGTKDEFNDWKDFLISDKNAVDSYAILKG